MPHYLMSYDLRAPGRNYDGLYTVMDKFGAVRVLESVWVATLSGNAASIRDIIKQVTDPNDGVLVVEITQAADWALKGATPAGKKWFEQTVP